MKPNRKDIVMLWGTIGGLGVDPRICNLSIRIYHIQGFEKRRE